jgi:hypothetical protein
MNKEILKKEIHFAIHIPKVKIEKICIILEKLYFIKMVI